MGYIGSGPTRFNTANELTVTGDAELKGNTTIDGNLTVSGTTTTIDSASVQTVDLGDGDRIRLGDDNDLQIYKDPNADVSWIVNNSGELKILNNGGAGQSLNIMAKTNENSIVCVPDYGVTLFFDNAAKLATVTNGVDVTGTVTSDGLTVAGNVSVDGGTIKLDGNYPVGSGNVALGDQALDDGSLSGGNNTAIGYLSMSANTTGNNNVAMGAASLDANISGAGNVAIGVSALGANTASNNTAVGLQALQENTTGFDNVAIGRASSDATTTGAQNTSLGGNSLTTLTVGNNNTAIGFNSLLNATGSWNTAIGKDSGQSITTGEKNTILGSYNGNQGGLDIRTSGNNIVLSDGDGNPRMHFDANGRGVINTSSTIDSSRLSLQTTSGDNAISIRSYDSSSSVMMMQFYTAGMSRIGFIQTVGGTSTTYSTSSDYRLKENVVDMTGAIDRVKQLKPSQFNFITAPDTTVDGFLAHEVQDIVPEAITGTKDEVDDEGNPVYQGIDQSKLVPLLTAALKEAITEIESLKARVETLENA